MGLGEKPSRVRRGAGEGSSVDIEAMRGVVSRREDVDRSVVRSVGSIRLPSMCDLGFVESQAGVRDPVHSIQRGAGGSHCRRGDGILRDGQVVVVVVITGGGERGGDVGMLVRRRRAGAYWSGKAEGILVRGERVVAVV